MKSGWVKKFADKTREFGWDKDVSAKKASWSRGRLDDITAVSLHFQGHVYRLLGGPGEYHQVDSLTATFSGLDVTTPAQFLNRRIAKKINENDIGKRLRVDSHDPNVTECVLDRKSGALIKSHVIGRWLVLEVSNDGKLLCQIRDKV